MIIALIAESAASESMSLPVLSMGPPTFVVLFLAAVFGVLAVLIGRMQVQLGTEGWIPAFLRRVGVLMRGALVFSLLWAVIQQLPMGVRSSLPWFALALTVAFGWSVQAFLPDLLAGMLLRIGGQLPVGRWIHIDGVRGKISNIGLLGTRLQGDGGEAVLPNRRLLDRRVQTPADAWPCAELSVEVPLPTAEARQLLQHLALSAPWTAPAQVPSISKVALSAHQWSVRVAVLEPSHITAFENALQERIEAALREQPTAEAAS